jgi:hypothetical protein
MTAVLYFAMCLAALRSPNEEFGRDVVFSVTVGFVALCALTAFAKRDRYRLARAGFALFASAYLLLGFGSLFGARAARLETVVEFLLTIVIGLIGAALGWVVDARSRFGVALENRLNSIVTIAGIFYSSLCAATLCSTRSVLLSQAVHGLTVAFLLTATIAALARPGRLSLPWTGFAVFGWSYSLWSYSVSAFELAGLAPRTRPKPVTEYLLRDIWLLYNDCFYTDFLSPATFFLLGHSVLVIVIGLVGALMGGLLSRENPGSHL